MKNALIWLSVFTITALNSSCAIAMGKRPTCDPPEIPPRPQFVLCISNAQGVGQCFNPETGHNEPRSMNNYICKSPRDYATDEEWINAIISGSN